MKYRGGLGQRPKEDTGIRQRENLTSFLLLPLHPQTFLNPWYEASLLPIYAVTVSMGLWAFITAGGSLRGIQRSLSCKD